MKPIKISTIILLTSIIFYCGCTVLNKYEVNSFQIDLTKFEKQGIFATTGDLSQKYKSISILTVNCYDGYSAREGKTNKIKRDSINKKNADDAYASNGPSPERKKFYEYRECSIDDLCYEMITQAKNIGANGIIKLEIRFISRNGLNKEIQRGIEISGLAVKI